MTNRQLVSRFFDVFFADSQQLQQLCSQDVTLHFRGSAIARGLTELIEFGIGQHQCFPNLQFDVQTILVDGNKAAARLIQRGTHQHEWDGISACGQSFEVEEMMFFDIDNGRIQAIYPMLDLELKRQQLRKQPS
ncbi:hypothetical protein GCM10011369_16620 [Neiella marina]|uniref:SnoaL-like domain-containing protein n=1 Tax=Neiella marina TaxID=508461 RepID=A0A8J2U4H7_9GAMM|nr:ester cyclase [Neiella marina]GGA75422.1 hypothetical protein GCM10011369_16620 [Neiella marina]